jgi:DNA-binding NarL/FixJ family response regulator
MKIQALLVDPQQLFRDATRALLELQPDIEVVGGADNIDEAVAIAAGIEADVVCLYLPRSIDAADAIQRLMTAMPQAKFIGLSDCVEWSFVSGLVSIGMRGYVSKNADPAELVDAIRTVVRGNRKYFCRQVTAQIVDQAVERFQCHPNSTGLAHRELQVLRLVADGHTSAEIGQSLHIRAKSVNAYRSTIMHKLGLANSADMTRYAVSAGISSGYSAQAH